jgi:hypothetical protein
MSNDILRDFVASSRRHEGVGYFDGDQLAIHHAHKMSKRQKRGFERYHKVPTAFFEYLKDILVLPDSMDISSEKVGRKIGDLLEVLHRHPTEQGKEAAEYLRKLIMVAHYAVRTGFFSTGSSAWRRRAGISKKHHATPNDRHQNGPVIRVPVAEWGTHH